MTTVAITTTTACTYRFRYLTRPTMDSNNNSHSTNVSTDYRYSEQDGDQTSWQLSHTAHNDSFSHKELGVTVGGLNTDTINSAVNGRWDGAIRKCLRYRI